MAGVYRNYEIKKNKKLPPYLFLLVYVFSDGFTKGGNKVTSDFSCGLI